MARLEYRTICKVFLSSPRDSPRSVNKLLLNVVNGFLCQKKKNVNYMAITFSFLYIKNNFTFIINVLFTRKFHPLIAKYTLNRRFFFFQITFSDTFVIIYVSIKLFRCSYVMITFISIPKYFIFEKLQYITYCNFLKWLIVKSI